MEIRAEVGNLIYNVRNMVRRTPTKSILSYTYKQSAIQSCLNRLVLIVEMLVKMTCVLHADHKTNQAINRVRQPIQ